MILFVYMYTCTHKHIYNYMHEKMVPNIFNVFNSKNVLYFPASLRYIGHVTQYKFKVDNIMI